MLKIGENRRFLSEQNFFIQHFFVSLHPRTKGKQFCLNGQWAKLLMHYLSLRWVFLLEKINQKSFSLLKTNATHTSTPGLKIEISENVKPFFANDFSMSKDFSYITYLISVTLGNRQMILNALHIAVTIHILVRVHYSTYLRRQYRLKP